MAENILKGSIVARDFVIIGDMLKEIELLIERNPFSARMHYLLENQDLASKAVLNIRDRISPPNCIGTAFFIAGVGSLHYPYHAYSYELNLHMSSAGQTARWDDCFRKHIERRIPGAFIFSYSLEKDDWHAGIYLGEVDGEHLSFAQHGHSGKFGPETISRNYCNPDYYLPSTLPINGTTDSSN